MTSCKEGCDCVLCYQEYLKPFIKGNKYREYPLYDGHPGCSTDDGVKCLMLRKDYNDKEKLEFTTCPCTCHYRIRLGLEATPTGTDYSSLYKGRVQDKDDNVKGQGNNKDCVCTTRGLCECGAKGPEQTA